MNVLISHPLRDMLSYCRFHISDGRDPLSYSPRGQISSTPHDLRKKLQLQTFSCLLCVSFKFNLIQLVLCVQRRGPQNVLSSRPLDVFCCSGQTPMGMGWLENFIKKNNSPQNLESVGRRGCVEREFGEKLFSIDISLSTLWERLVQSLDPFDVLELVLN